MTKEHEKGKSAGGSAQQWGKLIRQWRDDKGWARGELIARYQKKLEAINASYEFSEIPSESWLARVENGRSVTVSRQQIVVLCEALECTQNQLMTIMLYADRNVFADPDGEVTTEGEVLALTTAKLMRNDVARRVIQQRLQNRPIETLPEDDLFDILLAAISAVRKPGAVPPTLSLSGAD